MSWLRVLILVATLAVGSAVMLIFGVPWWLVIFIQLSVIVSCLVVLVPPRRNPP